MELWKVRRRVNPADLFTKHLASEDTVTELLGLRGCRFIGGRAESAPLLRESGDTKPILNVRETLSAEARRAEIDNHGKEHLDRNGDGEYAYPMVKLDDSEEYVKEAFLHDPDVLPHLIPGDRNRAPASRWIGSRRERRRS